MARPKSALPSARSRGQTAREGNRRASIEKLLDSIDDDLEFTVTFPTPSLSHSSRALDTDHDSEPVVFIFGWEGAEDEDLVSYTRMYESWGCISIRYTSPARWRYLLGDRECRDTAERLGGLLSELCLTDNPVIVHCLSNNATNIYLHLKQMLPKGNKLIGVIFEGVKRKTIVETLSGTWRYVQCQEKTVLSILISLLWFILYLVINIVRSMIQNSAEDRLASESSPSALFLVAKDPKVPYSQDDIFHARHHMRRKVKDDSSDDRIQEFDCGDFKEMISKFPDHYPQSILDFLKTRLA